MSVCVGVCVCGALPEKCEYYIISFLQSDALREGITSLSSQKIVFCIA